MSRRDRGAVLLLVLAAVAILAALSVEVASRASVDALAASRASREAAFRRLFDSGVEVAKGLLTGPKEPGLPDSWRDASNVEMKLTLNPGEELLVRLADESGKINIARAITHEGERDFRKKMLGRLFDYLERRKAGRNEEWRELEGKVLARLGMNAHASKPVPLLTLDGLRESGLTVDQIYGPGGLSRYLTCFGDGRINLNTAPRGVLYALSDDFDLSLVDRIAGYRGDEESEPGEHRPFERTEDLQRIPGIIESLASNPSSRSPRNLYIPLQGLVTTTSSSFSVRMEARVAGMRHEAWAIFLPLGTDSGQAGRGVRLIALEEIRP